MANDRKITAESYIYKNGELVNTNELSKSDMEKASITIKLRLLNCLFNNRAEFSVKKDYKVLTKI